jgi:DNA-binding MarR family transcriptional regulator
VKVRRRRIQHYSFVFTFTETERKMTNVISNDDAIASLAAAIKPFQDLARDTLVTVSVSLVQVFLMIASTPDKSNSELAKAFGMSNGTVSRILSN